MGNCLTRQASNGDNVNTNAKQEKPKEKVRTQRSSSMQNFWASSWTSLIGNRSASKMNAESSSTQCKHSYDTCNCVQRAIFVMNIYKFWNDRKHIELDIDHIVQVITKDLTNYSKEQMINDLKHSQASHALDELNQLFQTKCKNC
eukprot:355291_1